MGVLQIREILSRRINDEKGIAHWEENSEYNCSRRPHQIALRIFRSSTEITHEPEYSNQPIHRFRIEKGRNGIIA